MNILIETQIEDRPVAIDLSVRLLDERPAGPAEVLDVDIEGYEGCTYLEALAWVREHQTEIRAEYDRERSSSALEAEVEAFGGYF